MKLKGLYLMPENTFNGIYGKEEREQLAKLINIEDKSYVLEEIEEKPSISANVDVIMTGWGCPKLDKKLLDLFPALKAVFYGAGSIKGIVTESFWEKNIPITSAYAANAVPVAEFTFSQIIMCLKNAWHYAGSFYLNRKPAAKFSCAGGYKSTVGIVSLGMIGKMVVDFLKIMDVKIIAYDPYIDKEYAERNGVELHTLEDVFRLSDVVSLHTPALEETRGMIKGKHILSMKKNSGFINTARGMVVDELQVAEALVKRPDIQVVLDVTYPEPPAPDNPLLKLPNVMIFPHIAGSASGECNRMAKYMILELERFLKGEKLMWQITKEKNKIMA